MLLGPLRLMCPCLIGVLDLDWLRVKKLSYDPVKNWFVLLPLILLGNNHFNTFVSALKPFIAESKLIAELSKKFVMINVEVMNYSRILTQMFALLMKLEFRSLRYAEFL